MKTLIEIRDFRETSKIVKTIERTIYQTTNGGIRTVIYKNKPYCVMGGIRNNLCIYVEAKNI